jgi:hypothetical protein
MRPSTNDLAFFGGIVLGIFGQIALRARFRRWR